MKSKVVEAAILEIEEHDYGQWPEGPNLHTIETLAETMAEAMEEFVDRCDKGECRSTYTYNKFRKILGLIQ